MKVGILGGGQLARMLAEAAFRLGLEPVVFCESSDDPAAQVCPGTVFGTLKESVSLKRFFSQIEVVVFENEFVDCGILEKYSKNLNLNFTPNIDTLAQLQDKLSQKRIFNKLSLPCPHFEKYEPKKSLKKWIKEMLKKFKKNCVFKWSQHGYDGKGVWIVQGPQIHEDEIYLFLNKALKNRHSIFCEEKISYAKELALVSVYSTQGECVHYPLVITEQEDGICKRVSGPAIALGVNEEHELQAREYAKKIAHSLALYGSFAIEFFLDQSGKLLINEIAPRVHNSGHFTLDAAETSQFENHLRAVLGLPLGRVEAAPGFAMLNLLGNNKTEAISRPVFIPPQLSSRVHLHWYGKMLWNNGRKLGHLNGRVTDPSQISLVQREMLQLEREWLNQNENQTE